MEQFTLTIDGKNVIAEPGMTILQAAASAGINIPTLCHHPALSPAGSCRICVVEIEKQRMLQPACAFPASPGMVVTTENERIAEARRFSLQMLFSERPHYCMYCPVSGGNATSDCELQQLAYRYGLNCWEFIPNYQKRWTVDATRSTFVMDHSRCVLCRRCVRACSEVAANHTLGVSQRGARSMICADDEVPFGQSTCVECGTCLQVCPTGALTDRLGSYRGHETEVKRTKTTCVGCAVGCGIEVLTRDNQIVRIEGDWTAANRGLLCSTGRFKSMKCDYPRLRSPLLRKDGVLVEASWEDTLSRVVEQFRSGVSVAGMISPRMTNRLLAGFAFFFSETLLSNEYSLLYGETPALELGRSAELNDIDDADCIVVIEANILSEQQVLGYFVKRAADRGAQIITVSDTPTELSQRSALTLQLEDIVRPNVSPFERLRYTYHLRLDGMAKLRAAVETARRVVVIYPPGLSSSFYSALRTLPKNVMFMPVMRGANTMGAHKLGLEVRPISADTIYVLVGDDTTNGWKLPEASFRIVQSAYRLPWINGADVVLPARTWYEKTGEVFNLEGRKCKCTALADPPQGVRADLEILLELSVRLGIPLPYDQISDMCAVVS